jgi:hypothetical protein
MTFKTRLLAAKTVYDNGNVGSIILSARSSNADRIK